PHHRGPHRGQRPRSLCARRLLLELQFAGVQGQVARGCGHHRLRQARRAPKGLPAHHCARCGEWLPLPARQDRRVEEGAGRHVGERPVTIGRFRRRLLEGVIEFLSRRLAAALVTLALATVVVFAVVEVLPGDPALIMLGTDARPDTLAALRAQYGFDQPLLARYLHWIGGLLSFDLGTSHAYGTSVAKLIGDRRAVTLPLGALALGWALLVAIP